MSVRVHVDFTTKRSNGSVGHQHLKRTDDRATQIVCKGPVKTTPIILDRIPDYLKPKGIFLLQDTLQTDHRVFDSVPALCFLFCFSAYIKVKQSYAILGY